jgi:hypothetical protein
LAVHKEGTGFGFGWGGHDVAEDGAGCVDGAIEGRLVDGRFDRFIADEEMTASTTACLRLQKVGSIAVDVKGHATSVVSNGCVGM